MPEGPFRYKSAHTPVRLSEIEEALLVGAGGSSTCATGVTALASSMTFSYLAVRHMIDGR
jgi:hypothetical protein